MVFIDLRNSARNSSAGNWLSGTFSAKEERFLSISPLFSVFISTMYPKDVHPFVQSGHHQMFASAWGELLFFPEYKVLSSPSPSSNKYVCLSSQSVSE